jgi:hypothetical protein
VQSRCNDFIEAHTEHLLECLHILQIWVESIRRSLLQLSNFFLTVLCGCFKSLASYSLGLQNGPRWAGPYTVISLGQVSYDVNALLTLSPGDYLRWGSSHNTKDQHRLLQNCCSGSMPSLRICTFSALLHHHGFNISAKGWPQMHYGAFKVYLYLFMHEILFWI